MKRILALFLCLCLALCVSACKPDNIKEPAPILSPEAEQSQADKEQAPSEEQSAPQEEQAPVAQEEKKEEVPADDVANTPAAEQTEQAPLVSLNPLAAEGFIPSKVLENTLPLSEFVNTQMAVSVLENRTLTFYTADDVPAFTYLDEKGKSVSEWKWMQELAEKQGFILKYSIKDKAVSLKAQRTALYAGKKLSLVQLNADEAGAGLSLTRPATDYINKEAAFFGISKNLLAQSADTLFAPVGNVNALWYNTALMPADTDPATLAAQNAWSLEKFKAVYSHAISLSAQPLEMKEHLAWGALSGKSPLTLLNGKLDSNLNAKATREVWAKLQAAEGELFSFVPVPEVEYSLKSSNRAMQYSPVPDAIKEETLSYAPLPSAEEGGIGAVTYVGTYFALPKYHVDDDNARAALTFAEYWCNRYSETIAAKLKDLGIAGGAYEAYIHMAETQGHLILHHPKLEEAALPYLEGIKNPEANLDALYRNVKTKVEGLITLQNLYY